MLATKIRTIPILVAICTFTLGTLAHAATLELTSSIPTNNAVDVARTDALTLQFSASLSTKSVNASAITLQSAAGNQKVSLSVSGAVISVRPSTPLLPWTRYTLNATSLIGSNGEQLATPVSVSFKTRDASWQAQQPVYNVALGQWYPVSATNININGIRFIAWIETNNPGVGYDVWAVRQVPGQPSTDAVLVARFPNSEIFDLKVFVDDSGNAFATWVTNNVPHPVHVWVNRFTAGSGWGSGWGTPQIINGNSKLVGSDPHLAFDHAGNALALWRETDWTTGVASGFIVTSRYTQATGWSKPVYLDNAPHLWGKIDIQVDNAGNAYATWSTLKTTAQLTPQLLVSRYSLNVGWSAPQIIATEYTTHTDGYQALAVNPRGEAFLMWADDNGLRFARANSFGNWDNPTLIDSTITTFPTQMVLIDNGQAFAAFGSGVMNFMPDKGYWSSMHPLQTDRSTTEGGDVYIVADLNGNAMMAWPQVINHIPALYAKRYRSHWGWLSAVQIDIDNPSVGAEFVGLLQEPDGNVVLTWLQSHGDGSSDMEEAHFE